MAKRTKPARTGLTRKQLSRARREARIQRLVLISAGIIAIAVVGLIAFAIVRQMIILPTRVVATVNGEQISAVDFQDRVKFDYYLNYYIMMGGQSIEQLAQYGIDAQTISQESFDQVVKDTLIRQKAAEMGIAVSDAKAEEHIQLLFGFDAGEPEPTSTPTVTPEGGETTPTATATFVYTQTPSPTPTLEPGVTPTLTPIPSLTPTTTETPSEPPTVTPTSTPFPTSEPLTEEEFLINYDGFVSQAAQALDMPTARFEEQLLEWSRNQLLVEKLMEEFDFPVDETKVQVHAAHILVETEEEALAALDRIEQEEEFELLAAELSTDSSNAYKGGDLGWYGAGQMVAEFEDVSFSLPIGEISSPVETQFGWHIIKVYDRVDTPLTSQEQDQQRQSAFEALVSQWRAATDITTEDITPYIPKLP